LGTMASLTMGAGTTTGSIVAARVAGRKRSAAIIDTPGPLEVIQTKKTAAPKGSAVLKEPKDKKIAAPKAPAAPKEPNLFDAKMQTRNTLLVTNDIAAGINAPPVARSMRAPAVADSMHAPTVAGSSTAPPVTRSRTAPSKADARTAPPGTAPSVKVKKPRNTLTKELVSKLIINNPYDKPPIGGSSSFENYLLYKYLETQEAI
jgi:hypothetical protein